jgi:hypothetical protein
MILKNNEQKIIKTLFLSIGSQKLFNKIIFLVYITVIF